MSLSFAQPYALGLLLLLPLFYLVGRARLARLPIGARRAALATRLAVVALVVLALAEPWLTRTDDRLSVVYAVDTSDSVPEEALTQARAWIGQSLAAARGGDAAAIIAFGADAAVVKGFGAPLVTGFVRHDSTGTNIARALHLAQSIFPASGGRRVVLFTDGHENAGKAEEEARYLAQQGIQVSVAPIAQATETREVLVESLDAPQYLREGESFDVGIGVYSTHETPAVLRVFADGQQVSEGTVRLRVGGNRFAVRLTASAPGFHRFHAQIDAAGDVFPQNNQNWAYTVVKGAGKVLAIANRPEDGQPLRAALEANGIRVDTQTPASIPSRLAPLEGYDGLILVNVPASSLTLDQMLTITSFVRSRGRGLVAFGGDSSFSLGGYGETPLAEALPVIMSVPGGVERGNVGMLLVVDKSGSMEMREEDVQKVGMAREAAQKAVAFLENGDAVGVLAFDTATQVLVEPQMVGNQANRQKIHDLISRLEASGGTDIRQALESAVNVMVGVRTRYRHIILLSDGRPNTDVRYDDLIARMQAARITLSTIAIGSDADLALMEELAKLGHGRYYYAEKAKDVPTVTMREARLATGATSVDGTFRPKLPMTGWRSPLLKSLSESALPPLAGYVVTIPKDEAQVALVSEREEPILTHWYYGLGRVVAWTSDLTPKWAAEWLAWPEFARFWSQVVRWSLRSAADPNTQVTSAVSGGAVTVRVDVADESGSFQDLLDVRARVLAAEGQSDELRLTQTRPGRYETTFGVPSEGAYQIEIEQRQGDAVVRRETSGFVVPYPPEYGGLGSNTEALRRVANLTGGRFLREPRDAFGRDVLFDGQVRAPLAQWLLTLAVLLFPIDVGVRRLKISPSYLRRRIWVPVLGAYRRASSAPGRAIRHILRYRPL